MAGTTNTGTVNSEVAVPVELGEVVLVKGEKIIGVVSYIGTMYGEDPFEEYVGLTLSDPVPHGHNGTARGHQYFECADKHGIIINSTSVSRRVSPPELLHKVTSLNNAFKSCYTQSQELKRKLNIITETLSRVEGENQHLRQKIRYYEQQLNYHAPYLDNAMSPNLEESPSPSPSPSASPSPNPTTPTRFRSQSHQIQGRERKRRTFNKPLPPLPHKHHVQRNSNSAQTSPQMGPEERRLVAKYKKKSYEKRRKYQQRSNSRNSRHSFKTRRRRNASDTSKSTLASTAQTLTSTADHSVSVSPVPLSIGDDGSSFQKLLIPHHNTKYGKRLSGQSGGSCNESESHDVGDMSQFDDQETLDGDDLFPIKSTPRGYNGFPSDKFDEPTETVSHTMYNEPNDLDIDQITTSYPSTKNIFEQNDIATPNINELSLLTPDVNDLRTPDIIQESPQIVSEDDVQTLDTPQTGYYEESPEYSYGTNQDIGVNHLEIDSPIPPPPPLPNPKPDVHIKVYKADTQQEWQMETKHAQTTQSHGGSNLKLTARASGNSAATFKSSIPDNVGLYSEQEHIATTMISDSQSNPRSNTPSYTQSNPRTTLSTISPHKSLRQRVIPRKSLTPVNPSPQVKMSSKFNPMRISKSQVHLTDVDKDDTDIVYCMSDDNTASSNNSHNVQKKKSPMRVFKKRKSMGIPTDRKILKKRVIRSRTFVSNTNGQKYDHMNTVMESKSAMNISIDHNYEEEKSPQPFTHTPILLSTTPQTTPLHALHPPNTLRSIHAITLDDFELNSNHEPQYNQHPFQHQHYHSSIQLATKKVLPPHLPVLTNTHSAGHHDKVNAVRRRNNTHETDYMMNVPQRNRLNRTKSTPCREARNLSSLTDREVKGFLEADNLFMYNGYQ